MLNKYGKLLLGAYILKKLESGNSHEVPAHKRSGMLGKYGKLVLGAYLMKKLRVGKHYGTGGHEESTQGMLHRYGKLMLTTYAVKKLRPGKSHDESEQSQQCMESSVHGGPFLPHLAKKYGKWLLGMFLAKKLHHEKPKVETTEIIETETYEENEGSSMIKLSTIVVGTLAGAAAIYAFKKYNAKERGHKIEVD